MTPDIPSIITRMTLEEKAALTIGASAWTTTPIERLGVPEMLVSDGPHGIRRQADVHEMTMQSLPATCFPTASCSASSWNVDLLAEMGGAIAEEAIALGVNVVLGPGVNMKRSPLGGRNFEYFAEDPYLAGELAAAWIEGLQAKGVGASLKHYAVNSQEHQRFTINAVVDERTLREIYLPAFEKAVRRGRPWTVMCSYNKINGTFGSEHQQLLTEILKEEWGFEGLVVSDWGAVRDRVAALQGGLDWEMPGPQPRRVQQIVQAITGQRADNGALDEAVLDEAVRRILGIVFKACETRLGGTFDQAAHHRLARKIAAEGMVLLKNDGLLPLKGQQKIAVIGRSAKEAYFQGGGSSHINPTQVDAPFDELQARVRNLVSNIEVAYAEGYPADGAFRQDLLHEAAAVAQAADVAVLFLALPGYKESEGYDRSDLYLTAQQVALIHAVAQVQPKTVVVINSGSPVAMAGWIERVPAVLQAWMMGQAGGGAIADILTGQVNPSGKLTETVPLRLEDTPAYLNWPGEAGQVRHGEGLFIGYRWYDARKLPVQFPFGYGLSYTTFEYSNPKVSSASFRDVDGLTVTVDVTNTGAVAGQEIVQVYVHDRQAALLRPEKELKGFAKVALEPGETKTVAISLDFRAFAYWHPDYGRWITEDGACDILIGASAADIRHSVPVTLESSVQLPCILHRNSTIREWMSDPRGQAVFGPFYRQMEAQSRQLFIGDEVPSADGAEGGGDPSADGGMDFMAMMGEMPLVSVLLWLQNSLPAHPEDMVDGWLAQARAG